MKLSSRENKKIIYAIEFEDLPFPEIDKYVCVPISWTIHRLHNNKVLVAYPVNEAPFVTKNRIKNREERNSEWRFYIGFIKFESENYEDVEKWIEDMIAKTSDDQEEKLEIKDSQSEPVESRQLRSSKNPVLSSILPEKRLMAMKPCEHPRKPLRPWKQKWIEQENPQPAIEPSKNPPVNLENQVIQSAKDHSEQELVDTSIQFPPKLPDDRQSSPEPTDEKQSSPDRQDEEPLSAPKIIYDLNIDIEPEFEIIEETRAPSKTSEQVQPNPISKRPTLVNDHDYLLIESRLQEIHSGQPKANDTQISLVQNSAARPPNRVIQPQQDHVQPSTLYSKLQGGVVSSEVTHNYQSSYLQNLSKTVQPPTYHTSSAIDLPSQRQIPVSKRKSSAAIKQPVKKKANVGNIKNIPTTQQLYTHLNYDGNVENHGRPLHSMNTFAAQNLLHLAHQARFYEPSQLQYLQQTTRTQEMINRLNMPVNDQRTYAPNPITGYVSHQNQILPQNQWPLVNTNPIHELRHEVAVQNHPARNLENLQRQNLLSYQDPRIVKPQVTEEIAPQINQQLSDQRNNSCKHQLKKLSIGPIKITECPPEITQNSEIQTTFESQETQFKVPEKHVYQHPESKKLMADQATEIELIEDHHKDNAAPSPPSIDNRYQIDKHPTKDEEVLDSEMVPDEEILDESTDGSEYAEDRSEEDDPAITKEGSTDGHSFKPEPPEKFSQMSEQEMLEVHGLILTKMYKHFLNTEEYYNNLRVTTLACLKLYQVLKNKVEKDNEKESRPIPTSDALEAPQVAQETPAPTSEKNPNDEQKKNSSVNAPTKNKKKHTFVLPPEYDPIDSKWTLKYRGPGRGLMELIPQSHVYVNKAEYNKCIRASNNCRTLARMLLKAVFSKNALSVCSPTGAKARAFNTVDMDIRPGLDENARMVLLAFIEDYGNKRNWNTSDTAGIMSSIRTKIQEMRNKYGQTKVV